MSTFHAYVDAAHFHEALGNVLRFAAKRSRLPILEEAQVRFEDGHCVLTCTNLDQWCMSTIPAVGDSFSFVFVGTRKILSACKYFSGELELTYTIEPTETNPDPRGQISISDGKRSLKRSTERTSDFPELKEKPLDRHYWNILGHSGLLVPCRDRNGYIQGLQIRLDDETKPDRKYRWLSSRGKAHGTRSYSYIHVTGNIHARTAYLTEGG